MTAFSFTYVPWQYRNVFAGGIAVFWQTYLSWLNRKEEKREGRVAEKVPVKQEEVKRVEEQPKVSSRPTPKPKKRKKRKVEDQEEEKS